MIQEYNFDTINSNYNSVYNDPYNTSFTLQEPLHNIKKVYLKSIEMPINFTNVRDNSTLNKISLLCSDGVTYSITLANAVYTSISTLMTDINSAFVNVVPSTTVTFSLSGTTKVKCILVSSVITFFNFVDTQLSKYLLGFRNTSSSMSITTTSDYLLNVDNYIVMYLSNISDCNKNSANMPFTFKIPLNAVNGIVYFTSENITFTQYITISNPSFVLSKIDVKIYDRFGNAILAKASDYSFTLAFE